jgi:hypothetical protein
MFHTRGDNLDKSVVKSEAGRIRWINVRETERRSGIEHGHASGGTCAVTPDAPCGGLSADRSMVAASKHRTPLDILSVHVQQLAHTRSMDQGTSPPHQFGLDMRATSAIP